ncbi:MAG: lytic transglycosylase domain-containing protein [Myxococcales bacterium]|nr:lytic transglycosylase domain-containing protein [Myxococcales bacterium]
MRILWRLLTVGAVAGTAASAQAYDVSPVCAVSGASEPIPTINSSVHVPPAVPGVADVCDGSEPARIVTPREPTWSAPIGIEQARKELSDADHLAARGALDDALLHLRVVERATPEIEDRIALERGELLLELGVPERACRAFATAARSPDRNIAARARIGAVTCRLRAGDRDGEKRLQALLRRYPQLSERQQLRLELAHAREAWGNRRGAAKLFRAIDVADPASPIAAIARAEVERLAEAGVVLSKMPMKTRVERAERLLRSAPVDVAAAEVEALRGSRGLNAELRARVHVMAARIARIQGRWDAVKQEIASARRQGVAVPDAGKLMPPPAATRASEQPEVSPARRAAERRIKGLRRGRPIRKLTNTQLRLVLDLAVRHSMKDTADEVVEAMTRRKSMVAAARFESAIRASGLASDEKLAPLLETIIHVRRYRVSGTYHYARALERLGRTAEAESHYLRVIERDRSATRYYAMWAEQRLWAQRSASQQSCAPPAEKKSQATKVKATAKAKKVTKAKKAAPAEAAPRMTPAERRERVVELLEPIAQSHGEAYPWLQRALSLVQLERFYEAGDEINEAYLAYRDARGSPRLRSGLEAVYTGSAPPRRPADWALRRARLSLEPDTRKQLAKVAELVGDPGVALRFGDWRQGQRPRAYTEQVHAAAAKYGVDPNLLFAVMRVESIYNRRIVSYAGAVGLMQIMPHTGRRIAERLGVEGFETTDLLDPETNLEFSAWYLASLLKRFDGRLPLAIASYNGGPHNVRLWMRANHPDMPLDAFLERIPFSQTHRYVRRVLTHYAAYRAQRDLPMTRLSVDLPEPQVDSMAF